MKLTAKAIKKIGENRTAAMIALALGLSEDWIKRLAKKNKENGDLTKAKALQVIREETGLTDSEILEEEPVTVQR
jgi:hypothetical protein